MRVHNLRFIIFSFDGIDSIQNSDQEKDEIAQRKRGEVQNIV